MKTYEEELILPLHPSVLFLFVLAGSIESSLGCWDMETLVLTKQTVVDRSNVRAGSISQFYVMHRRLVGQQGLMGT